MPYVGDHAGPRIRRTILAIGASVRRARRSARLSQQALADRAGVAQSTISRLERGLTPRASLWVLAAIITALEKRSIVEIGLPWPQDTVEAPRDESFMPRVG